MKALILNSGMGTRMGPLTAEHPKCMTDLSARETILSRQLRQLAGVGIQDVVITTGLFDQALVRYCRDLNLPLRYTFVHNPDFRDTNYIYSIYLAREYLDDDLLLLHGDLVLEDEVLRRAVECGTSCMAVSAAAPLPRKDFKAVIQDGRITAVGVEFFDHAAAAQPLYRLTREDWRIWLSRIEELCRGGDVKCYAEKALNQVTDRLALHPLDVGDLLCAEVDDPEDLAVVSEKLRALEGRTVYLCFSTDIVHGGHLNILRRAAALGRVTVGVLSDQAVASYKRFPLLTAGERRVDLTKNELKIL